MHVMKHLLVYGYNSYVSLKYGRISYVTLNKTGNFHREKMIFTTNLTNSGCSISFNGFYFAKPQNDLY